MTERFDEPAPNVEASTHYQERERRKGQSNGSDLRAVRGDLARSVVRPTHGVLDSG